MRQILGATTKFRLQFIRGGGGTYGELVRLIQDQQLGSEPAR